MPVQQNCPRHRGPGYYNDGHFEVRRPKYGGTNNAEMYDPSANRMSPRSLNDPATRRHFGPQRMRKYQAPKVEPPEWDPYGLPASTQQRVKDTEARANRALLLDKIDTVLEKNEVRRRDLMDTKHTRRSLEIAESKRQPLAGLEAELHPGLEEVSRKPSKASAAESSGSAVGSKILGRVTSKDRWKQRMALFSDPNMLYIRSVDPGLFETAMKQDNSFMSTWSHGFTGSIEHMTIAEVPYFNGTSNLFHANQPRKKKIRSLPALAGNRFGKLQDNLALNPDRAYFNTSLGSDGSIQTRDELAGHIHLLEDLKAGGSGMGVSFYNDTGMPESLSYFANRSSSDKLEQIPAIVRERRKRLVEKLGISEEQLNELGYSDVDGHTAKSIDKMLNESMDEERYQNQVKLMIKAGREKKMAESVSTQLPASPSILEAESKHNKPMTMSTSSTTIMCTGNSGGLTAGDSSQLPSFLETPETVKIGDTSLYEPSYDKSILASIQEISVSFQSDTSLMRASQTSQGGSVEVNDPAKRLSQKSSLGGCIASQGSPLPDKKSSLKSTMSSRGEKIGESFDMSGYEERQADDENSKFAGLALWKANDKSQSLRSPCGQRASNAGRSSISAGSQAMGRASMTSSGAIGDFDLTGSMSGGMKQAGRRSQVNSFSRKVSDDFVGVEQKVDRLAAPFRGLMKKTSEVGFSGFPLSQIHMTDGLDEFSEFTARMRSHLKKHAMGRKKNQMEKEQLAMINEKTERARSQEAKEQSTATSKRKVKTGKRKLVNVGSSKSGGSTPGSGGSSDGSPGRYGAKKNYDPGRLKKQKELVAKDFVKMMDVSEDGKTDHQASKLIVPIPEEPSVQVPMPAKSSAADSSKPRIKITSQLLHEDDTGHGRSLPGSRACQRTPQSKPSSTSASRPHSKPPTQFQQVPRSAEPLNYVHMPLPVSPGFDLIKRQQRQLFGDATPPRTPPGSSIVPEEWNVQKSGTPFQKPDIPAFKGEFPGSKREASPSQKANLVSERPPIGVAVAAVKKHQQSTSPGFRDSSIFRDESPNVLFQNAGVQSALQSVAFSEAHGSKDVVFLSTEQSSPGPDSERHCPSVYETPRNDRRGVSFTTGFRDLYEDSILNPRRGFMSVSPRNEDTDYAEQHYMFEVLPDQTLQELVHHRREAMEQTKTHAPVCPCFKCFQRYRYDNEILRRKFFKPRDIKTLIAEESAKKKAYEGFGQSTLAFSHAAATTFPDGSSPGGSGAGSLDFTNSSTMRTSLFNLRSTLNTSAANVMHSANDSRINFSGDVTKSEIMSLNSMKAALLDRSTISELSDEQKAKRHANMMMCATASGTLERTAKHRIVRTDMSNVSLKERLPQGFSNDRMTKMDKEHRKQKRQYRKRYSGTGTTSDVAKAVNFRVRNEMGKSGAMKRREMQQADQLEKNNWEDSSDEEHDWGARKRGTRPLQRKPSQKTIAPWEKEKTTSGASSTSRKDDSSSSDEPLSEEEAAKRRLKVKQPPIKVGDDPASPEIPATPASRQSVSEKRLSGAQTIEPGAEEEVDPLDEVDPDEPPRWKIREAPTMKMGTKLEEKMAEKAAKPDLPRVNEKEFDTFVSDLRAGYLKTMDIGDMNEHFLRASIHQWVDMQLENSRRAVNYFYKKNVKKLCRLLRENEMLFGPQDLGENSILVLMRRGALAHRTNKENQNAPGEDSDDEEDESESEEMETESESSHEENDEPDEEAGNAEEDENENGEYGADERMTIVELGASRTFRASQGGTSVGDSMNIGASVRRGEKLFMRLPTWVSEKEKPQEEEDDEERIIQKPPNKQKPKRKRRRSIGLRDDTGRSDETISSLIMARKKLKKGGKSFSRVSTRTFGAVMPSTMDNGRTSTAGFARLSTANFNYEVGESLHLAKHIKLMSAVEFLHAPESRGFSMEECEELYKAMFLVSLIAARDQDLHEREKRDKVKYKTAFKNAFAFMNIEDIVSLGETIARVKQIPVDMTLVNERKEKRLPTPETIRGGTRISTSESIENKDQKKRRLKRRHCLPAMRFLPCSTNGAHVYRYFRELGELLDTPALEEREEVHFQGGSGRQSTLYSSTASQAARGKVKGLERQATFHDVADVVNTKMKSQSPERRNERRSSIDQSTDLTTASIRISSAPPHRDIPPTSPSRKSMAPERGTVAAGKNGKSPQSGRVSPTRKSMAPGEKHWDTVRDRKGDYVEESKVKEKLEEAFVKGPPGQPPVGFTLSQWQQQLQRIGGTQTPSTMGHMIRELGMKHTTAERKQHMANHQIVSSAFVNVVPQQLDHIHVSNPTPNLITAVNLVNRQMTKIEEHNFRQRTRAVRLNQEAKTGFMSQRDPMFKFDESTGKILIQRISPDAGVIMQFPRRKMAKRKTPEQVALEYRMNDDKRAVELAIILKREEAERKKREDLRVTQQKRAEVRRSDVGRGSLTVRQVRTAAVSVKDKERGASKGKEKEKEEKKKQAKKKRDEEDRNAILGIKTKEEKPHMSEVQKKKQAIVNARKKEDRADETPPSPAISVGEIPLPPDPLAQYARSQPKDGLELEVTTQDHNYAQRLMFEVPLYDEDHSFEGRDPRRLEPAQSMFEKKRPEVVVSQSSETSFYDEYVANQHRLLRLMIVKNMPDHLKESNGPLDRLSPVDTDEELEIDKEYPDYRVAPITLAQSTIQRWDLEIEDPFANPDALVDSMPLPKLGFIHAKPENEVQVVDKGMVEKLGNYKTKKGGLLLKARNMDQISLGTAGFHLERELRLYNPKHNVYDYFPCFGGPCRWKRPLEKAWLMRMAKVYGKYAEKKQSANLKFMPGAAATGSTGLGMGPKKGQQDFSHMENLQKMNHPLWYQMLEATADRKREQLREFGIDGQAWNNIKTQMEMEEEVFDAEALTSAQMATEKPQYHLSLHLTNFANTTVHIARPNSGNYEDRPASPYGVSELLSFTLNDPTSMFNHKGIFALPAFHKYSNEFARWFKDSTMEKRTMRKFLRNQRAREEKDNVKEKTEDSPRRSIKIGKTKTEDNGKTKAASPPRAVHAYQKMQPGELAIPDRDWLGMCGLISRFRFSKMCWFEHFEGEMVAPSEGQFDKGKHYFLRRFMFRITPLERPLVPILSLRTCGETFIRRHWEEELDLMLNQYDEVDGEQKLNREEFLGKAHRPGSPQDKSPKSSRPGTADKKGGRPNSADKKARPNSQEGSRPGSSSSQNKTKAAEPAKKQDAKKDKKAAAVKAKGKQTGKAGGNAKAKRKAAKGEAKNDEKGAESEEEATGSPIKDHFPMAMPPKTKPIQNVRSQVAALGVRKRKREKKLQAVAVRAPKFSVEIPKEALVEKKKRLLAVFDERGPVEGDPLWPLKQEIQATYLQQVERKFDPEIEGLLPDVSSLYTGSSEHTSDAFSDDDERWLMNQAPPVFGKDSDSERDEILAVNDADDKFVIASTESESSESSGHEKQIDSDSQHSDGEKEHVKLVRFDLAGVCSKKKKRHGRTYSTWDEVSLMDLTYSESVNEIVRCHKNRSLFARGRYNIDVIRLKRRRTTLYRLFHVVSRQLYQITRGLGVFPPDEVYCLWLIACECRAVTDDELFERARDFEKPLDKFVLFPLRDIVKDTFTGQNPVSLGIRELFVEDAQLRRTTLSGVMLSSLGVLDSLLTCAKCCAMDLSTFLDLVCDSGEVDNRIDMKASNPCRPRWRRTARPVEGEGEEEAADESTLQIGVS